MPYFSDANPIILFVQLEGSDAAADDPVHLKRRVGLFSGVALIVGTMIGKSMIWFRKVNLKSNYSTGAYFRALDNEVDWIYRLHENKQARISNSMQ